MANTMTGNKNKLKTNTGVMDSYLQKEQKEQTVTPANNKRQSNVLSPLEDERSKTKKKNPKTSNGDKESDHAGENSEKIKGKKNPEKQGNEPIQGTLNTGMPITTSQTEEETNNGQKNMTNTENTIKTTPSDDFNTIIGSLVDEMRNLRQTVHHDIVDLQSAVSQQKVDITQIEQSVKEAKKEIKQLLIEKIDNNTLNIQTIMNENKMLKRENEKLKDRMNKLEKLQLENNVLISGQPEEAWEPYERTKGIVLDTILTSLNSLHTEEATRIVKNIEITNCKCIGRYKIGRSRPISVTFHKKDDKQRLLENKRNLPMGVYVNEEFPLEIKRNRDTLRPILKLAKSLPEYRDKSKLVDDKLIINGSVYTVHNLHQLPNDLAPYKATQKVNETVIGFSGELSPWSNLHKSPFELNGIKFTTAEQWIQYTKSNLFGDTLTSDQILNSETAMEAKRLSYNIQGYDPKIWHEKGYHLCLPGIKAKFIQNPPLLKMLKTTSPKLLVESTIDKTWGTGVPLKENDALNREKWHNSGWLSSMLLDVRDST